MLMFVYVEYFVFLNVVYVFEYKQINCSVLTFVVTIMEVAFSCMELYEIDLC